MSEANLNETGTGDPVAETRGGEDDSQIVVTARPPANPEREATPEEVDRVIRPWARQAPANDPEEQGEGQ